MFVKPVFSVPLISLQPDCGNVLLLTTGPSVSQAGLCCQHYCHWTKWAYADSSTVTGPSGSMLTAALSLDQVGLCWQQHCHWTKWVYADSSTVTGPSGPMLSTLLSLDQVGLCSTGPSGPLLTAALPLDTQPQVFCHASWQTLFSLILTGKDHPAKFLCTSDIALIKKPFLQ